MAPPPATQGATAGERPASATGGAAKRAEPAGGEKADQATGEIGAPEAGGGESGARPEAWRWPYGGMQSYGAGPGGYPTFYPPYPFFGYPFPFMGMFLWPYWMPYFMPPYPMMSYPYGSPAQSPYPVYPAQQQPYPGKPPRKRSGSLYAVLIIIGLLIIAGGAVAALLLLTGKTSATYRLGDGSVTGVDIEFREMVLRQNGNVLTLTGTYDNNTKDSGNVIVTIQAISKGSEQLVNFSVPVEPGTGKTFSKQQSSNSIKLSGAMLSSLVFEGSTQTNPSNGSYPWSSTPQESVPSETTSEPTLPFSVPESSSTYEQQLPDESLPLPTDSDTSPDISLPIPLDSGTSSQISLPVPVY